MRNIFSRIVVIFFVLLAVVAIRPSFVHSQTTSATPATAATDTADIPEGTDTGLDQGLFEDEAGGGEIIPALPSPVPEGAPAATEKISGGEAKEGENRWLINITGAVVLNYVFNDNETNPVIKYRFEIIGQANANTAVITGDADINAQVEGPLAQWPTGECRLEITVPKVPFELTFNRSDNERGTIRLVFKKAIIEDWQSKCSFTDAPSARFDTRGAPEAWLAKALEKARPPLKDITADLGPEETTTKFVISKDTLSDPPLGSVEMEGTGFVSIKPVGAE